MKVSEGNEVLYVLHSCFVQVQVHCEFQRTEISYVCVTQQWFHWFALGPKYEMIQNTTNATHLFVTKSSSWWHEPLAGWFVTLKHMTYIEQIWQLLVPHEQIVQVNSYTFVTGSHTETCHALMFCSCLTLPSVGFKEQKILLFVFHWDSRCASVGLLWEPMWKYILFFYQPHLNHFSALVVSAAVLGDLRRVPVEREALYRHHWQAPRKVPCVQHFLHENGAHSCSQKTNCVLFLRWPTDWLRRERGAGVGRTPPPREFPWQW